MRSENVFSARYSKLSKPGETKDTINLELKLYARDTLWLSDPETSQILREEENLRSVQSFTFKKEGVWFENIKSAISTTVGIWYTRYRVRELLAKLMISDLEKMVNKSEENFDVLECSVIHEKRHTTFVDNIADTVMRLSMEESAPGMVPATDCSIESLKRKTMTESESCSVCLDDIYVGSEALSMPCLHLFHGDCLTKWLKTSHYCPNCRYEMPTLG